MNTEMGKIAEALGKKADRKETGLAAYWWRFKVVLGVADTTPLQIKSVSKRFFVIVLLTVLQTQHTRLHTFGRGCNHCHHCGRLYWIPLSASQYSHLCSSSCSFDTSCQSDRRRIFDSRQSIDRFSES